MMRRGLGDDRGSVVAEFAVALPAVVLVLLLGAGSLGACARQVRLQDAAADAARLAARSEAEARASAVVSDAVPGAVAAIERRGDLVCVHAEAPAVEIVPISLSASSCALDGGL
jgi:Flp pilus assembly protein TadG